MRYFFFLGLLWVLTACAGNPVPQAAADLPTLAELPTLTATETGAPSATPTATLPATHTQTATITPSATASVTPSVTITDTPSRTPTSTPSPTPRQGALFLLAQVAENATVLPQEFRAPGVTPLPTGASQSPLPIGTPLPVTCSELPPGGFGIIFFGTPSLAASIGCPSGAVTTSDSAVQPFEHGAMIWMGGGAIYALYNDGRFQRFDDTFDPAVDPDSGGEVPPAGLVEPVRGFGKVWRSYPDVRSGLGWGNAPEIGGSAALQRFERGWMIDLSQRSDIVVLAEDPGGQSGTWQSHSGSY